jgi:hypothetical protein
MRLREKGSEGGREGGRESEEAACSASLVDKIFKENGGKALVALEK